MCIIRYIVKYIFILSWFDVVDVDIFNYIVGQSIENLTVNKSYTPYIL